MTMNKQMHRSMINAKRLIDIFFFLLFFFSKTINEIGSVEQMVSYTNVYKLSQLMNMHYMYIENVLEPICRIFSFCNMEYMASLQLSGSILHLIEYMHSIDDTISNTSNTISRFLYIYIYTYICTYKE